MIEKIKEWYNGKTDYFMPDNEPDSNVFFIGGITTEYHWTAKIARFIVRTIFSMKGIAILTLIATVVGVVKAFV